MRAEHARAGEFRTAVRAEIPRGRRCRDRTGRRLSGNRRSGRGFLFLRTAAQDQEKHQSEDQENSRAGGDENPTNDAYQAFITSPDGKSVNLRRGPGTGYSVIAAYPIGTPITVISRAKAWSVVEVDGRRGYIRNDLITEAQPAPTATPVPVPTEVPADVTPEPTAVPGSATVWSANGLSVNVHRGPGTGYSNVTRVSPGDVVYVLSYVSSKWAKIQLMDGREGYIKTEFLK